MANFLIIAGTSDIGSASVKKLLEQGHKVHITGTQQEKTEQMASMLGVECSILDASDFLAVDSVFADVITRYGSIDGVANFAGSLWLKNAAQTDQSQFEQVLQANLTTAFAVVRAAEKHMKQGGAIVLLSSAAALSGLSNHEAIAAAKAGVIGLALAAAASFAPSNLRVNVVAPGLTETRLTQSLTTNAISRKVSEAMHALGRIGSADEVANAVCFLLDPANSWITGQVLAVDGGLSRVHPKAKT